MTTPQFVSAPTAGHWALAMLADSREMPSITIMHPRWFQIERLEVCEEEKGCFEKKLMNRSSITSEANRIS